MTTENKNNYFSFYFNHPEAPADALVADPEIFEKLSASGKVLMNNFDETVYSYNYGEAHFIVLNTGTYVNTGNETYPDDEHFFNAQREWLKKDLEENKDAKWKIIMVHEAMYNRTGKKQDRTYLTDIVESYGVDLVIEGHSHILTRTYPMKNGEIVTKSSPDVIDKGTGTIYMTIGSTTTGHDALSPSMVECMQTVISQDSEQPAYTTVTIKDNMLVLTTRQLDGLVLDSFYIRGEGVTDEMLTEAAETEAPIATEESTEASVSEEIPATAQGCGSVVSLAGIALVVALGACTAFVSKKKED